MKLTMWSPCIEKAIDVYKRNVMELAKELKEGSTDLNGHVFARIRNLVTVVIVRANPSRSGGAGTRANAEDDRTVKIEIKGHLAALCENPAIFPNVAMSPAGQWHCW